MNIRLLGIQIANGYSPEARVYAGLLAHVDSSRIERHTLHHARHGDLTSAAQFQKATNTNVQTMDFGWRSVASDRSLGEKARARLQFLASLPRALSIARSLKPDVIYSCQQFWDCQAATYIARKLGKPQIIHLHYTVGPWLHKPVLDRLRTCDHVIAISDFIHNEGRRHGISEDRITTIRNTVTVPPEPLPETRVEVRRQLGIPLDAPVLGIVARLDPGKGQADAIQAFVQVQRRFPSAHLLIVGDETPWFPGYEDELKAMAAQCGVAEQVHFLGRRSDVPRLLSALDIFVHPSRQEPFGLSVAEASAAGLPVVAYTEGGTCEIVGNGLTGLLTPTGDWNGLAQSVSHLLNTPDHARSMGKAGRRKMEAEFRPEDASNIFATLINDTSRASGR